MKKILFYIHSHNIDEFEFLKELYTKEARELFAQEIENLFDTINSNLDFEITPIFLDFALDLDEIIDEIDEFRGYMEGLFFHNINNIKKYSILKGKKPNIFEKNYKR